MKKKQLLFLLIAYALSVTQIFAQQDLKQTIFDSTTEPERRRWEVGIDILPFLNNSLPLSNSKYLYIRKYNTDVKKKSALELSMGISFYDNTILSSPYKNIPNAGLNSNDYFVRFGKEFQLQGGRFMLLHGPFIGFSYNKSSGRDNTSQTKSNTNFIEVFSSQFGYKIGVRYFLSSRFSLSTSSSLLINYLNSDFKQTQLDTVSGITITGIETKQETWVSNLYPIATFQLGYHF